MSEEKTYGQVAYKTWSGNDHGWENFLQAEDREKFHMIAADVIDEYETRRSSKRTHLGLPHALNETLCGQPGGGQTFTTHDILRGKITCGECIFIHNGQQEERPIIEKRRRSLGRIEAWAREMIQYPESPMLYRMVRDGVANILHEMNPGHPLAQEFDTLRSSAERKPEDWKSVMEISLQRIAKHPKRCYWDSPEKGQTSFNIWFSNHTIEQLKRQIDLLLADPFNNNLQALCAKLTSKLSVLLEPGDHGYAQLPLIEQIVSCINVKHPKWKHKLTSAVNQIRMKGTL